MVSSFTRSTGSEPIDPFLYFCEHVQFEERDMRRVRIVPRRVTVASLLERAKSKQKTPGRVPVWSNFSDTAGPASRAHQVMIKNSWIGYKEQIDLDTINLMDYMAEVED
jgi:hypothetical protein